MTSDSLLEKDQDEMMLSSDCVPEKLMKSYYASVISDNAKDKGANPDVLSFT